MTLFLSCFFFTFLQMQNWRSGSKGAWYFPCKSHFNLLKREVITLFLFAICLWWMLLFSLSPPGYNLSLKPKLENSKDELLKKVWIFTSYVLLIRKENRTMCNQKNHRYIYIPANMPPACRRYSHINRQSSPKILETPMHVAMLRCYCKVTWLQQHCKWEGEKKGSRIFQSVSRFLSEIVV